ncbi:MAG: MarR family transcriptional regulator [Ignavibacteria bacterium]|nr:MarR family transcriptional regulator [Ignavibacteria bacterium]
MKKVEKSAGNIQRKISPAKLQFKIKAAGLTQQDLAAEFNVSKGAISRAVNNDPKLQTLRQQIINRLESK